VTNKYRLPAMRRMGVRDRLEAIPVNWPDNAGRAVGSAPEDRDGRLGDRTIAVYGRDKACGGTACIEIQAHRVPKSRRPAPRAREKRLRTRLWRQMGAFQPEIPPEAPILPILRARWLRMRPGRVCGPYHPDFGWRGPVRPRELPIPVQQASLRHEGANAGLRPENGHG
jgi:hypothetical protein